MEPTWVARAEGLVLEPGLLVSFQRYLVDEALAFAGVPRSVGCLEPADVGPSQFLVPVHQAEAVWVGVSPRGSGRAPALIAFADCGHGPVELAVDADGATAGLLVLRDAAGDHLPFAASPRGRAYGSLGLRALSSSKGVGAEVGFVTPAAFREATGREPPQPASLGDAYGGWRLP